MASIVTGYEYDIFISYRQNDNKYDGWVTGFVANLNRELEATIKDKLTIYFDENPSDGLLETHDVDKSLESKLRCLIFIPVISQTYCDLNCYAWQNELCAFNRMAKEDTFGRDIRLPGGNVASRILPVKINELDPEDKALLENELGGVLRAIEFIYREPGVNRPLTPDDDEEKNLNKTKYRNQINKVANAIKEIIRGIQEPGVKSQTENIIIPENKIGRRKIPGGKIAAPVAILITVLIAVLLFVPPLIKRPPGSSPPIDKSIAVLPFTNLSNDPDQEYFSDGMVDEIIDRLFKIGDLKVISRTTSMSFKNTTLSLKEIARELNVSAILEGSVRRIENNVRITVQLIDAGTDTHLWSEIYDRNISDIFSIQSEVAQAVARELKAVIKPEEKHLLESVPTDNLEAYDLYLLGEYLRIQRTPNSLWKAKGMFEKAIEADPGFVKAYTGLAHCYGNLAFYANLRPKEAYLPAFELAQKALELDSLSADAYSIKGMVDLFYNFNFTRAEKNYKRAIELAPKDPECYKLFSELYFFMGKFSEALDWDHRALTIDPSYSTRDGLYGSHMYFAGEKDSALLLLTRLVDKYPVCHYYLGVGYIYEGEYEKAIPELEKILVGFSPVVITHLGIAYSRSGALNETRKLLDTLETRAKTEFVPYSMRGALMASLGRKKEAIDYLRKGYDEREEFLLLLMHVDTISYANLRSDPEFIEIINSIKK
jgi:TolB-like protein/Tfp pilus assembly protein PilF